MLEKNAQQLSTLVGMDETSMKQIMMLYYGKNGGIDAGTMTLPEFVSYIQTDIMNQPQFAVYFDDNMKAQIHILAQYTDVEAMQTVELLYMLYASNQHSLENADLSNQISMDQLFDFLVNHVIEDPRFAAFFDDEAKEQLSLTADTLKTGKQSLVGEHYSRLIVTTSYGGESDEVYDLIDQMIEKLDGTEAQYYIIGDSAMSKELSGSFAQELLFITLLTAVAIFLVVAVAFRSISIPIILVGVIQCAIFTTFSVAYFQGISTYFICLLIVQAILMGASIDYAILFTSYYKVERLNHSIKDAITASYNGAISTILTSASILVIVTFAISKVFSDPTTSQVCSTISKGALVATILVIFVLPSLLAVFDRFVVRKGKREDA